MRIHEENTRRKGIEPRTHQFPLFRELRMKAEEVLGGVEGALKKNVADQGAGEGWKATKIGVDQTTFLIKLSSQARLREGTRLR